MEYRPRFGNRKRVRADTLRVLGRVLRNGGDAARTGAVDRRERLDYLGCRACVENNKHLVTHENHNNSRSRAREREKLAGWPIVAAF